MNTHDEHDDDLEPEVIEGAEIETENYEQAENAEEGPLGSDVTDPSAHIDEGRTSPAMDEEAEDEASDTI
jgi:hypothetical protein